MKKQNFTRRQFLATASAGTAAAIATSAFPALCSSKEAGTLAVLGGKPLITKSFPWPSVSDKMEKSLVWNFFE